jgi:hypothetical protein
MISPRRILSVQNLFGCRSAAGAAAGCVGALLGLATLAPIPVAAQQETPGAVEGTIHEQSAFRSVRAAQIAVRRVEPDTALRTTTAPDGSGRYRVDSLPPGRYQVRIVSAALDSFRAPIPTMEVRITPGRVVLADFTLPSGEMLRDALCGDGRLGPRRAAVVGRATDADADDRPLADAELVATWMDFPVDRLTGRSQPTPRVTVVKTGKGGDYLLCGVPTETLFTLRLRSRGRAGALVQLLVPEDEGVIARDLSLSTRSASAPASASDSVRTGGVAGTSGPTTGARPAMGTAELSGTVRGLSGEPFANAEVHVRDASASVRSDSAGRFLLRDLPAGTQILVVERAGYAATELPVELRPGRRVDQSVLLVRPQTLDDVRMSESALEYEAFDANRRLNPYGQFLTVEQIDKKKSATETVDLFDDVLGFTAFGHGDSARVISNMALARDVKCSSATVFIQGVEGRRINDVAPRQIAGIEAYADPQFVPARYAGQADCGVVAIWLRKYTPPAPSRGPTLRGNGYP